MAWDRAIGRALSEAIEADNIEEFDKLLETHPDHIRGPSGRNYWMKYVAMQGKTPFLDLLLRRGIDVNDSDGSQDPDDEFYEPEGPVLWAASQGQIEAVQWFLSHGAKINYVVRGGLRCLPMMFAAQNGHLDVVKLLVEHGGEWQTGDNGRPPAWYAEQRGQKAVLEYLKSLEK